MGSDPAMGIRVVGGIWIWGCMGSWPGCAILVCVSVSVFLGLCFVLVGGNKIDRERDVSRIG